MPRLVTLLASVALALAGAGLAPSPAAAPAMPVAASAGAAGPATVIPWRPFAATSPFNVPIAGSPALDPNSAAMVARVARDGMGYANLVEFGIPIYEASASTPRVTVRCTITSWGPCPFAAAPRAMPASARPSSGSDGAMVVVDRAAGTIDEYWQAAPATGGWTTSWGAINPLTGSGWGGGSTGAGASRLAGVVRVAEIHAGTIPHALVVQSDNVCAGTVRAPALKTDGDSTRPDCIPEGARLQLDPAIDVARIPGITPGEITVARALQVYGAYLVDRAGTSLAVSFEVAPDATAAGPGSAYAQAGFGWDYDGMPHIPWGALRVLQAWNG
ncbi:hypothetical protein [Nakamurella sp.]|uniref:hypothetical protein n=1 Tax=Nakamurella sp. TaxID=1869182 RepID=UPI003B3A6D68